VVPNEQIEDIKIEKLLSFLLILFQFMIPYRMRKLFESTETSSTLALIPEIQKVQERSLLEVPNEQIEDIKIEKLPEFSSYIIPVHDSPPDEKLFEKTQSGPP
jgi:hypothetical protein